MKKKILTHIAFFLILEIIYILFSTIYYIFLSGIYSRDIDILGSLVWNLVLTSILFCLNLIENKKFKWIIIIAFICIPHLALTILGAGEEGNEPLAGDMVDLLVMASPGNIPFLPWFQLGLESRILNKIIYYIMFFYGPLLYWYFAYRGSKKIVSKFWNDQRDRNNET